MATIRQHRDKHQVLWYDSAGRKRAKSFKRRTDAVNFARAVETDKLRGEWSDPTAGRMTLAAYASTWIKTKADVRARTRINIEGRLRNHILPMFGDMRMVGIRPEHVRAWVAHLSARGLSPATVKGAYLTLGQIMRTA